jgi:hypothetical protein
MKECVFPRGKTSQVHLSDSVLWQSRTLVLSFAAEKHTSDAEVAFVDREIGM